jgi:hypothetical protein
MRLSKPRLGVCVCEEGQGRQSSAALAMRLRWTGGPVALTFHVEEVEEGERMTETEWLEETSLGRILDYLYDGKISNRKMRLFAVGCCRRLPGYPESEIDQRWLELTERDVDGQASEEEFDNLEEGDCDARWYRKDGWNATARVREYYSNEVECSLHRVGTSEEDLSKGQAQLEAAMLVLLRDVVGNPFRDAPISPGWLSWNGNFVPQMAQSIYDDRSFDRLPILADALEEAGCTDAVLLGHCRGPGPHVRGCWVVDLLLGKP